MSKICRSFTKFPRLDTEATEYLMSITREAKDIGYRLWEMPYKAR